MKNHKCSDFRPQEIVKADGIICKVIMATNGWVTCVPKDKCKTFEEILDNEFKTRPKSVKKRKACLDCAWPCNCQEFER